MLANAGYKVHTFNYGNHPKLLPEHPNVGASRHTRSAVLTAQAGDPVVNLARDRTPIAV